VDERYLVYFDETYRRLTGPSTGSPVERDCVHKLPEALAVAESALTAQTGKTLRADARLWLHLNLLQMVIAPVAAERRERLDGLFEALRADLQLVLTRAAVGEGLTEVSAYRVMVVLARAWEELAVAGWGVWGEGARVWPGGVATAAPGPGRPSHQAPRRVTPGGGNRHRGRANRTSALTRQPF
jgi:hypothetical protein